MIIKKETKNSIIIYYVDKDYDDKKMEKIFHSTAGWFLIKIVMGLLIGLLMVSFSSCGPDRRIMHTPSKRAINRAMRYSTWEYNNVRPTSQAVSVSVNTYSEGVTH